MIDIYIRDINEARGKHLAKSTFGEILEIVESIKAHGANLGEDDAKYYDSRFCENYNDQRFLIFEIIVDQGN